jgi:hypothetical protein
MTLLTQKIKLEMVFIEKIQLQWVKKKRNALREALLSANN